MRWYIYILLVLFSFGCTRSYDSSKNRKIGSTNLSRVEKRIVVLEGELEKSYEKIMTNRVDTLPIQTIHLLEANYKRAFKLGLKNELSPEYLDKLQQLYLQEKKYGLSLTWTDTLLKHYPFYKQKAALLLSAATTAEIYLKDQTRMRYYYGRLLREHPKLKKEVVDMVEFRLKKS